MAKQIGLFKFEGKLGNMVCYKLNGKNITRTIGAVDRHKMRTAPQYTETRKNQSIFAQASKAGQLFRNTLSTFTKGYTDYDYPAKVVSLMLQAFRLNPTNAGHSLSLNTNFTQSDILQSFRKLHIYNAPSCQQIPSSLLVPTSQPNQWKLSQQALWNKANASTNKLIQLCYLHIDFDKGTAQCEDILSMNCHPSTNKTSTIINLPNSKNYRMPLRFLIAKVYNQFEEGMPFTLQNIYILDIIDTTTIMVDTNAPNQTVRHLLTNSNTLYSITKDSFLTSAFSNQYQSIYKQAINPFPPPN